LANKPLLSYISIGITAVLLLIPGGQTPEDVPEIPFLDKIFHVGLFAACAFSLYFDFIVKKRPPNVIMKVIFFSVALLIAGGIIEVLQENYLHRTGSMADFIADFAGVILGLIVAFLIAAPLYRWMEVDPTQT